MVSSMASSDSTGKCCAEVPHAKSSPLILIASGFAAGVVVTGLLNPVDRALFLSISKQRPFLHRRNWRYPLQGVTQSMVGRAVSSGLWFPLERLFRESSACTKITEYSSTLAFALAGQIAGGVNALLLSPFAFIKYQTWGLPDEKRGFTRTARKIYRTAGTKIFFRGLPATVARDVLFGGCFSLLRRVFFERGVPHYCGDFIAAGAATIIGAPINYARNIQFGAPWTDPTPRTIVIFQKLWKQAHRQPGALAQLGFLWRRMNIGWGTLRVAGGMALTSHIFGALVQVGDKMSSRDSK